MVRVWCEGCESEISSLVSNRNLPLESFHLDFEQELNENDIYCSYCARNREFSNNWDITTNIRIAHDSFSSKIYFSPEIINYSPIELVVHPKGDVTRIQIELLTEEDEVIFKNSLDGRDSEDLAYIPPFTKNAVDFNWTYAEEGQEGVTNPEISKKYSGENITARATFSVDLYPDKLELDNQFTKEFENVQTLVLENNI